MLDSRPMDELAGRVAVVTGGGSGIGRGICIAFARAGLSVVVSDIEEGAAAAVAGEVQAEGQRGLAIQTDVADREAMRALAARAYDEFGAVHVLCNNAGVFTLKRGAEHTANDWDWVMSVNLGGVVNGLLAFLPRMTEQEDPSHIVNTSSTSGLYAGAGLTSYHASKYAVTGLTEHLRRDLDRVGIGVSLLCPGKVLTKIVQSGRNRPAAFGGPEETPQAFVDSWTARTTDGHDPIAVGNKVLRAIKRNDPYIVMNPERKLPVEARLEAIRAAFAGGAA